MMTSMKTFKAILLLTAVAATVTSMSAFAHGGHARARVGVYIGAPLLFSPWYYPHPYGYYYYPPRVVVPAAPTVYIERGQAASPTQPTQAYWYYCPESKTYYPYVSQCAVPWQRVVPQPPPS